MCVISAVQFSKRVGLIVRQLRNERGWSQQELALRVNYERSRIGRLELGQTAVTVDILLVLANALQVDIYSLLPVEVRLKTDVVHESVIECPMTSATALDLLTTQAPAPAPMADELTPLELNPCVHGAHP